MIDCNVPEISATAPFIVKSRWTSMMSSAECSLSGVIWSLSMMMTKYTTTIDIAITPLRTYIVIRILLTICQQ